MPPAQQQPVPPAQQHVPTNQQGLPFGVIGPVQIQHGRTCARHAVKNVLGLQDLPLLQAPQIGRIATVPGKRTKVLRSMAAHSNLEDSLS